MSDLFFCADSGRLPTHRELTTLIHRVGDRELSTWVADEDAYLVRPVPEGPPGAFILSIRPDLAVVVVRLDDGLVLPSSAFGEVVRLLDAAPDAFQAPEGPALLARLAAPTVNAWTLVHDPFALSGAEFSALTAIEDNAITRTDAGWSVQLAVLDRKRRLYQVSADPDTPSTERLPATLLARDVTLTPEPEADHVRP